MKLVPSSSSPSSRAFSLIEVLLAMFILGIGLIMVATIFPVGADWTRQTVEDSVSQSIAQSALTVIQSHYPFGSAQTSTFSTLSSTQLSAIPNFTTTIPLAERSYQFGNSSPFPAANPAACTYFWTALIRKSPNQPATSSTSNYDLYILVFHKGDIGHTFAAPPPAGYLEVPGLRAASETNVPVVYRGTYAYGSYNVNNTPAISGSIPAMGTFGIGDQSGTVFRQGISAVGAAATATPRPQLIGIPPPPSSPPAPEKILYSPPADNTNSGSPLVYVYQTTLTY